MKITLLGTSHGVPEPDRKCSCIMLEIGENIYFVDMGSSAIEQLRRRGKSIDAVKGVFITHMHGDHTNGLIQFIDLITWYFKTPDPTIVLPDPTAACVINDWMKVNNNHQEKKIQYRKTEAGVVYDDGICLTTMDSTPSFGFMVAEWRKGLEKTAKSWLLMLQKQGMLLFPWNTTCIRMRVTLISL